MLCKVALGGEQRFGKHPYENHSRRAVPSEGLFAETPAWSNFFLTIRAACICVSLLSRVGVLGAFSQLKSMSSMRAAYKTE